MLHIHIPHKPSAIEGHEGMNLVRHIKPTKFHIADTKQEPFSLHILPVVTEKFANLFASLVT